MGYMKRAMLDMVSMGMKPTNDNLERYLKIKRKQAEKNGTTIREEIIGKPKGNLEKSAKPIVTGKHCSFHIAHNF